MADAPERIWVDSPEVGGETDVEVGLDTLSNFPASWLTWVEYVRADLYQASQNALWERDEQWKRRVLRAELAEWKRVVNDRIDERNRLREAIEHALGHEDKPHEAMAILRRALAGEGE